MRLGWIGLGIMGARQAVNLRRAGHDLTVWNRTASIAEAWAAEHGATVAATPAEVAQDAEIVFSMVVDGPQVQEVLVGSEQGLDLDALVDVMAAGSGASTMLTLKAAPMRDHDYTTLFKTEHMLKDVRLCLEEAQGADVPFPAAASASDALSAAVARGHGSDDFAALLEAYEGFANRRL